MPPLIDRNTISQRETANFGFTLIEVIIAGGIMIILCVGTLTVFSHATKINSGNNLRAQAQSVLQLNAEFYRHLKFVPFQPDPRLNALSYTNPRRATSPTTPGPPETSADGQSFNITVVITNVSGGSPLTDENAKFKQITITATPVVTRAGWLSDASLNTKLVIQRVRAN